MRSRVVVALSLALASPARAAEPPPADAYLDVDLVCPSATSAVLEARARNRLGDRDRVTIAFANGVIRRVALAAAAEGFPYEDVFASDMPAPDPRGVRNVERILAKVRPALVACAEGGERLRRLRAQHAENRARLEAPTP